MTRKCESGSELEDAVRVFFLGEPVVSFLSRCRAVRFVRGAGLVGTRQRTLAARSEISIVMSLPSSSTRGFRSTTVAWTTAELENGLVATCIDSVLAIRCVCCRVAWNGVARHRRRNATGSWVRIGRVAAKTARLHGRDMLLDQWNMPVGSCNAVWRYRLLQQLSR